MFDHYIPVPDVDWLWCSGPSPTTWQGKNGPCLLLVWRQRTRHPIEHRVDEHVRLESTRFTEFTLPERFSISGFCKNGHIMHAGCQTIDGVWTTLDLSEEPAKVEEAREHHRGVFRDQ